MGIFNSKQREEESTELKIYLEKFRNRKNEGDYKTAMEIALRINWNNVSDAQLFLDAAEVFEKMEDYAHAKKLYEDAYVRSKSKERILYPLCIVSVKAGAIEDGVLFYEEFCYAYPDDVRKNKLKYLILKYKNASKTQLLRILEDYFDGEGVDEEMMYELAKLYSDLGNKEECVHMCDKLVMYYDVQNYGKAALELKQKYAPLTAEQQTLLDEYFLQKDSSLVKKKLFDYNVSNKNPEVLDAQNLRTAPKDRTAEEAMEIAEKKEEDAKEKFKQDTDLGETYQASNNDINRFDEIGGAFLDDRDHFEHITLSDLRSDDDEDKRSHITRNDFDDTPSNEDAFINNQEEERVVGDDSLADVISREVSIASDEKKEADKEIESKLIRELSNDITKEFETGTNHKTGYHMMIEGKSFKQCIGIAQNELKYIHSVLGTESKIAKVSADKINQNGLFSYVTRLGERDLVIEGAGFLKDPAIDDIKAFIDTGRYKNIIVLCDLVDNFDSIAKMHPDFVSLFDIVSVEVSKVDDREGESNIVQIDLNDNDNEQNRDLRNDDRRSAEPRKPDSEALKDWEKAVETSKETRVIDDSNPERFERKKSKRKIERRENVTRKQRRSESDIRRTPNSKEEQMEVADFASYCRRYADSIDCVISGKTIAALYERIEVMEEEGIKLTKQAAQELIDSVADKADHPNILSAVSGIFQSKYDKAGRLILKSEHFLGKGNK